MVFGAEEYLQIPEIAWRRVQESDILKMFFNLVTLPDFNLFDEFVVRNIWHYIVLTVLEVSDVADRLKH